MARPRETLSSNPAAGQDGREARTIGRMAAISNSKAMAGSPDADAAIARNVSQSCAWPLCFLAAVISKTMKDNQHV
jgi:hypothetical protein